MAAILGNGNITFGDGTVQSTANSGFRYQLFTASGVFTVPTGITSVKVHVLGGGASGQHFEGSNGAAGGTSSFGAYCSASGGSGTSPSLGGTGGVGSGANFNLYGHIGEPVKGADTNYGSGGFNGNPNGTYRNGASASGYGAGGGPSTYTNAYYGGNAGGLAIKYITGLVPGAQISVTIGGGGGASCPYGICNGAGAAGLVLVEW